MATASDELRLVAVRLKVAGAGGLRTELLRGLRTAAKPLIPKVQAAAKAKLPKGGGLNEQVASQKISVSIRTGAKSAGVRLTTTALDTKQTDAGYVRHPVFGTWRPGMPAQQIPDAAGWWSGTLAAEGPSVTPALVAVIDSVNWAIQDF